MRVLIDYRSALRTRSGVGEYTFRLVAALRDARRSPDPVEGTDQVVEPMLFSSSWKDRLRVPPELEGIDVIDRRVPVSVLNFAWHRLEWPSVEVLTGCSVDVAHSLHPLLMPTRTAAQVVTVHDLDFLAHPERTRGEIRRDYAALAGPHARRADHVVVVSEFTAGEVTRLLGVPRERISVCRPGGPGWAPRESAPARGYALFVGTLEPRKNVGTLLDAVERLVTRRTGLAARSPLLVLAGRATAEAQPWLERIGRAPLAGRVEHLGYVDPDRRRSIYGGARLLVQPSLDEGFGLPVLEAMTLGVPVVAARRGALPEVLGDAGLLVEAEDSEQMAAAIERLLDDDDLAARCSELGVRRAQQFQWRDTAVRTIDAYRRAIEQHRRRAVR